MFHNSEGAEVELCADRTSFSEEHQILALLPRDIRMRIVNPGDIAQIEGFRELFIHLNTDPDADELRRRIFIYFKDSPSLRGNLSQLTLFSCETWFN